VAAGGHYYALVAAPRSSPEGRAGIALWASGDGTNWALEESQPTLPESVIALGDARVAVAGERLVVVAWGQGTSDGDNVSVALLSPPLP
jgi:hypothetical protein